MLRSSLLSRLLLVALALPSSLAYNANYTTSKVVVHIPFDIHEANGYAHMIAKFGAIGASDSPRSLAEYVIYIESTSLCQPVVNITDIGHPKQDHADIRVPFLLLTDDTQGQCSAVTKARHAQQAGASALPLSDFHCRCSDAACKKQFPDDTCHDNDPVLVGDDSAADISIPVFLVFKQSGAALKENLHKDIPCLVELMWGLKNTDMDAKKEKAHVHFWSTAYDPLVPLETYVDLQAVVRAFHEYVDFSPRYSLLPGRTFQCQKEPADDGTCDHLCTNHGKYCTLHAKDLSGHDIVTETLRRVCIQKHYGSDNQGQLKLWNYTIHHKAECSDPKYFVEDNCINNALKVAGLDRKVLDQCMVDSGGLEDDSNADLQEVLAYQHDSGVVSLPAVKVNRNVIPRWGSSARVLFETICTEYWQSGIAKIPDVCEKCGSCSNTVGCLQAGQFVTSCDTSPVLAGNVHDKKVTWADKVKAGKTESDARNKKDITPRDDKVTGTTNGTATKMADGMNDHEMTN